MRKILLLLVILTVSLLIACGDTSTSNVALDRAPEAFLALQDEVRGTIVVQDADYACASATLFDRSEETCIYIIRYTTESATGSGYAYVIVSGETDKKGSTIVETSTSQVSYLEQIEMIHSQAYENSMIEAFENEPGLEETDFVSGTFTSAEIATAMEEIN